MTYFPYIFRDPSHLIAYTRAISSSASPRLRRQDRQHIAAVSYYGTRHTTSNKPIAALRRHGGLEMRVPDVPAYLAMPRACGANTTPIAFAEVYLALQNGTVDAQENPLTPSRRRSSSKCRRTSCSQHIVDHLNTVISKTLWSKLSDEDKKIFTEVMQQAAERTTKTIDEREKDWLKSSRSAA